MAAQAAFRRAVVAAGGTLLLLGGSTMAVSTLSMAVTKIIVDRAKKHQLVTCPCCSGRTALACSVCDGERILKYVPGVQQVLPGSRLATTMCACPMCEGSGEQTCVNCLGQGQALPAAFGWDPELVADSTGAMAISSGR